MDVVAAVGESRCEGALDDPSPLLIVAGAVLRVGGDISLQLLLVWLFCYCWGLRLNR